MHLSWRLLRPFPQAGSGFTSFCRHLESPFFFLFVSSCLYPSSWQVGHSSVFYGHGEAIWIVMLARVPPFGLIFTPIFLCWRSKFSSLSECRPRISCPWVEKSTHWSWAGGLGMNLLEYVKMPTQCRHIAEEHPPPEILGRYGDAGCVLAIWCVESIGSAVLGLRCCGKRRLPSKRVWHRQARRGLRRPQTKLFF